MIDGMFIAKSTMGMFEVILDDTLDDLIHSDTFINVSNWNKGKLEIFNRQRGRAHLYAVIHMYTYIW